MLILKKVLIRSYFVCLFLMAGGFLAQCILQPVVYAQSSEEEGDEMETYKNLTQVLEDYSHLGKPDAVKETYFTPYWEKGDWVFNRVKLKSTERPLGHFLQKGKWAKHDECNQICLFIYENYGEVCAQRLKIKGGAWKYEYKRFRNMCYLEYENCKNYYKRFDWYPIHAGSCPEFQKMSTNPTNTDQAPKRAKKWKKRIKKGKVTVGLNANVKDLMT